MHDAHHSAKIDINPQQDWEFWTDASGAPVSAVFLASQLQALLNIAKPEDAAALVDSLVRDLARLQLLLTAAGRRQDWARIEEQTGILISISAAIGADLLMEAGHTLRFAAENRLPDLLASGRPAFHIARHCRVAARHTHHDRRLSGSQLNCSLISRSSNP